MGQPASSSGPAIATGQDVYARYKAFASDPWLFCTKCVFTRDEVDKKQSVKRFPSHYEYLHYFVRIWERENRIVVPKSRRMFMSWVCIALYLHDAMFGLNRFNAFQSKKEDDSDSLVGRAEFIYDNIPESEIPRELLPAKNRTYCNLAFPDTGSEIRGFAQGADQLRQYTVSGLLLDEFAFWDKAEESYSAAIPTLEGGGRVTILSSAGPGFMKKIVFDQLDQATQTDQMGSLEDLV